MAYVSPEYTSDSDISEDTRELVRQGLATVKRKRKTVAFRTERLRERPSVPDMDTSQIRHPSRHEGATSAISTHGLNLNEREIVYGQNHNNTRATFWDNGEINWTGACWCCPNWSRRVTNNSHRYTDTWS